MNLAYYRKSTASYEATIFRVQDLAKKAGFEVTATTEIEKNVSTVVTVCNQEWMKKIIDADKNVIGFLPCNLVVTVKDNDVFVGVSNPTILGGVSRNTDIAQIAVDADTMLKQLVNEGAGVGPLKASKVILYATTTCPYCKMEASWLNDQKIAYEKVLVDLNPQAGERMVQQTGQMGVPVTEVQYDNGDSEFIVGFDKAQLASIQTT